MIEKSFCFHRAACKVRVEVGLEEISCEEEAIFSGIGGDKFYTGNGKK